MYYILNALNRWADVGLLHIMK